MRAMLLVPVALTLLLAALPASVHAASRTPQRSWAQCERATIAALERRAAREGRPASYYFGAGGAGAVPDIHDACGLKPSSGALTARERTALEGCTDSGDIMQQSNATRSWLWVYGEHSQHWQLAAQECQRVYAATVAARPSLAQRQVALCAATGTTAAETSRLRDSGIPLTTVLQLTQEGLRDLPQAVQHFLSALTVDIYRWTHWDATRSQREAEVSCMLAFTEGRLP